MISRLKNYKKEITILALWFPFLFAINTNLTDILYLGRGLTPNINAIRIAVFFFSFLFLFFLFLKNYKKIKLSSSIFFLYLIIFIIQTNFIFNKNFDQLISNFNIFFSGNIPDIIEYISVLSVGLEIQSIYMMIGSIGGIIYFIIFNNEKYEKIIKNQIIITSLIIASVYLYFSIGIIIEYLKDDELFMLYHSKFLNSGKFFGYEMTRSTGISRILVMISIITLLFLFRFKNNYLKVLGYLLIIFLNTTIILLSSRFGTYSYIIIMLIIMLFIKISYLNKIIIIITISFIPYFIQDTFKQYKLHNLIKKNNVNNTINFSPLKIITRSNKDYEAVKKKMLNDSVIINRNLIKKNKEDNSYQIDTTGRVDIWKKVYNLTLNNNINFWIGNGYQADRKLLTSSNYKNANFYGSNISNALLHIFVCSGLIGVFIFLYINFKILIRIFHFYFIEKIFLNYNANFRLIIAINIVLLLYLRCLVEISIAYYNIDFLIFLMCLYIIDKKRNII
ncbi:hypothetical protein OAA93_04530 [Candidatus Pelagibacter ubique]|nr:hypothetical protein [Candidatus Pelagibacter ubique]